MPPRGRPTTSNALIQNLLRGAVSQSFTGSNPLDKRDIYLHFGLVKRFYPTKQAAAVIYRDDLALKASPDEFIAQISSPFLSDHINIMVRPKGVTEICPKTGWESIVPEEEFAALLLAIKGDPETKGLIILNFVHMLGENDLSNGLAELSLHFYNSTITLGENEININSPSVKINGKDFGGA